MLITNLQSVPGKEFEIINLVTSNIVYSKHLGKDIGAAFKNMVGGELKGYTEMVEDAKEKAIQRLQEKANNLSADAILNVEFSVTNLSQGSAFVVLASGTAVRFI